MLNRRLVLKTAIGASLLARGAVAQEIFPNRPVRIVVPFAPGGPTDLLARIAGQRLSDHWKQPVVVENRAGASGVVGSQVVAKAPSDGYTLVLGNNVSHGVYELLNPKSTPYITMRDFAPVGVVGMGKQVLVVGTGVPVSNLKEFIAYAKANPGKLRYGSATGGFPHFTAEIFKIEIGADIGQVPFNGGAQVIQAVMSGAVEMYIGAPSTVLPALEAGKAKALALFSAERSDIAPGIPTLKEQGVDLVDETWFGLFAPAGVPPAILDKINADLVRLLASDEAKAEFKKLGFVPGAGNRDDFVALLKEENRDNLKVIKAAKVPINEN